MPTSPAPLTDLAASDAVPLAANELAALAAQTEVALLLWFDGPVLMLRADAAGVRYLWLYADGDATHTRWLVVPAHAALVAAYRSGRGELRSCVLDAPGGTAWLVDHVGAGLTCGWSLSTAVLPEEFLPLPGVTLRGWSQDVPAAPSPAGERGQLSTARPVPAGRRAAAGAAGHRA